MYKVFKCAVKIDVFVYLFISSLFSIDLQKIDRPTLCYTCKGRLMYINITQYTI